MCIHTEDFRVIVSGWRKPRLEYIPVTFTCWSMFLSCDLASWSAKYQDLRNWSRTWNNSSVQHLLATIIPVMETTSPWGREWSNSSLQCNIHTQAAFHSPVNSLNLLVYLKWTVPRSQLLVTNQNFPISPMCSEIHHTNPIHKRQPWPSVSKPALCLTELECSFRITTKFLRLRRH